MCSQKASFAEILTNMCDEKFLLFKNVKKGIFNVFSFFSSTENIIEFPISQHH